MNVQSKDESDVNVKEVLAAFEEMDSRGLLLK